MNFFRQLRPSISLLAGCLGLLAARPTQAQWLTQTVRLKPGWNAVYLFVDASHTTLDDLLPNAADPVAEVWLWRPNPVSIQFVDSPQTPLAQSSRWSVWTAARGDGDTLTRLAGNAAYLVRNSSAAEVVWQVKGRPTPPAQTWTSTGLNFIGFSTPEVGALTFDKFLAPAPGLDLAKSTANGVQIIRYPGGDLGTNNVNPRVVTPLEARSVVVRRGEAFWVGANTNYYNRYYGPVSVALQNPAGVHFGDSLGTYSIRLKNLTASNRTVSFNLVASEAPPAGQQALAGTPPLLVRGPLDPISHAYSHSVLNGNTFTLAPDGVAGAELEVVIGLNRAALSATPGSLYGGVLRVTDSEGFSQIDVPVTATVPDLGGLWVGEASVNQVGEYLKSYPKITPDMPAPRASFLDLDGNGFGSLPGGIPFAGSTFTVESWVRLRLAPTNPVALAGFTVATTNTAPPPNPNDPEVKGVPTNTVSPVTLFLTQTGGRLKPSMGVPITLDQAQVPEDGSLIEPQLGRRALSRDFGGPVSQGGQVIGFDLTMAATPGSDKFIYCYLNMGAAEPDKLAFDSTAVPHLSFGFRLDGRLVSFVDGKLVTATGAEPVWTAGNTRLDHHIDVACSDPLDGNPFDGAGSTVVQVFVDGGPTPVYTYTRTNSPYAHNFVSFGMATSGTSRVRNLLIAGAKPLESSVAVKPGEWAHVAFVNEAGVGRIYVNGAKTAEGPVPISARGLLTQGFIGASPELTNGTVAAFDDFRLWATARSEADIRRDLAAARILPKTPGLQAQYDFPPSGNPGYDSSGTQRDLVLQGTAVLGSEALDATHIQSANLGVALASANRPPPGGELVTAWTNLTPTISRSYVDLAGSEDGKILITAANGGAAGIYLSKDSGATWNQIQGPAANGYAGVGCSADGNTLVVLPQYEPVLVSHDAGTTWRKLGFGAEYVGIAVSENGSVIATGSAGSFIELSLDGGITKNSVADQRNWTSIACSADGKRLIASVWAGFLYTSADFGKTWIARASNRNWNRVASSADGQTLAATVADGQIYTSTDGGLTWTARENNRNWTGLACSSDGLRLVACAGKSASYTGGIYASTDGGISWLAQEAGRNWRDVVSSSDGSKLAAVVLDGGIYTKTRTFAGYELDPDTGLIRSADGSFVSTGVNTNLARTASAFPLRLILHGDTAANRVSLLQRVFIGKGATTTNTIAATRENLLDAAAIGSARRISAAHLPFSEANTFWTAPGRFQPGTALLFDVSEDYRDQASNPFLHTFHPDHDNLRSDFRSVEAVGVESYGIRRKVRLTLSAPGTDFRSLTSSSLGTAGTYEETLTLTGRSGATREFRLTGSFSLRRISPIANLTTQ